MQGLVSTTLGSGRSQFGLEEILDLAPKAPRAQAGAPLGACAPYRRPGDATRSPPGWASSRDGARPPTSATGAACLVGVGSGLGHGVGDPPAAGLPRELLGAAAGLGAEISIPAALASLMEDLEPSAIVPQSAQLVLDEAVDAVPSLILGPDGVFFRDDHGQPARSSPAAGLWGILLHSGEWQDEDVVAVVLGGKETNAMGPTPASYALEPTRTQGRAEPTGGPTRAYSSRPGDRELSGTRPVRTRVPSSSG